MKKHKRKQIECIYLEDCYGSHSQAFLTVRSVLWGMVEYLSCESSTTSFHPTENLAVNEELTNFGLPTAFGTSKRQKIESPQQPPMKRPKLTQSKRRKLIKLPRFEDHGDKLIEHNIGICRESAIRADRWFRVVGLASNFQDKDTEFICVRYLNSKETVVLNRMDSRITFVDGTNLESLGYIHAERDLWESFSWGKPSYVHEKYWDQRYRIFSKFDNDIKLDAESWYSITYEQIGKYVAGKFRNELKGMQRDDACLVMDCFSGCGGCTIPFASEGCHVFAVDIDDLKLKFLQQNCNAYGVADNVECIQSDVWTLLNSWANPHRLCRLNEKIDAMMYGAVITEEDEKVVGPIESDGGGLHPSSDLRIFKPYSLPSKKVDLIVLSPPWGGPDYLEQSEYDLSTMLSCGDGIKLVAAAAAVADNIIYIVPRNTIDKQLTTLANILGCGRHGNFNYNRLTTMMAGILQSLHCYTDFVFSKSSNRGMIFRHLLHQAVLSTMT